MHVLQMAVVHLTFLAIVLCMAILPRSLACCVAKVQDAVLRSLGAQVGREREELSEERAAGG